jgi:hypothetical protein
MDQEESCGVKSNKSYGASLVETHRSASPIILLPDKLRLRSSRRYKSDAVLYLHPLLYTLSTNDKVA